MRVFVLQRQFHTAHTIFEWATNTWGTDGADGLPPHIVMMKAVTDLGNGDPDAAEIALRRLLDDDMCTDRPTLAAAVHNNLAVTYRLKRKWPHARYHATKALDIWRQYSGALPGHRAGANELAHAALASGDLAGARRALDLNRRSPGAGPKTPDPILTGESLLLEARLALAEGKTETARRFLRRAQGECEGVRWLEMLIYVEKLEAALAGGADTGEKRTILGDLRTSIESWAV